jgi:sulfonate transport system ATP-binding protein
VSIQSLDLRRADEIAEFAPAIDPRTAPGGLPINIRWLQKSFGSKEVLHGIDLYVRSGEFVAVVGRSGCGKSTLLRLLVGLDQPSGGELWFGERSEQRPDANAVRIMFQEPRLLPWASVLGNVEVGLGAYRGAADARARAISTLREVGLEDRRDEWPSVLSGGQKQRVALARALVSRPRVLAFDEPLGALDALTRITMQRLLERVWVEQKFTALLVTHDVAEAVTLADRVLMIEDGEVTLDQRIDLPRPRERGSAEFAALEGGILRALLANSRAGEDA